MAQNLNQEYAGREHTSSSTRVETNLHGKVETAVSIDEPTGDVTQQPVLVGGSVAPVAWGEPTAEFPVLKMMIRKSGLVDFERPLREAKNIDNPNVSIAPLAIALEINIISEPFDEDGPLPTVVTSFSVNYLGFKPGGFDRKSNDILMATIMLQQTSFATVTQG